MRRVLVEETRYIEVAVATDDLFALPEMAVQKAHETPYADWGFSCLEAKPLHGTGTKR